MKKVYSLFFLFWIYCGFVCAQYSVGHTTITFFDQSRSRNIQTEIYYPSAVSGTDVAIANDVFPVIVFGHGFVISWDVYSNFWETLVPQGYIMLFPRTEGGMSPSHGEFGSDLRFLVSAIRAENLDSGSLFYGAVANETAIMGHSMGGGSSFLAAENNPDISALVTFAAAETNPSAISAASNISVPSLVFAGADDCVASYTDNQLPMYESLSGNCKSIVSINGGGHCYFGNYSFNCTFGESTCMPVVPITREEQHAATFDFLTPWLAFTLKGNNSGFDEFQDSLFNSDRISYLQNCSLTNFADVTTPGFLTYPNPVKDKLNIVFENNCPGEVLLMDFTGRVILEIKKNTDSCEISVSNLASGLYILSVAGSNGSTESKIVIKE